LFLLKTFKALTGLLCADVPLRNYSLTHLIAYLSSLYNKRKHKNKLLDYNNHNAEHQSTQ